MDRGLGKIAVFVVRLSILSVLSSVMFLTGVYGQQKDKREYQFEGSQIEGEREKPKDLYILPWQGTAQLEEGKLRMELLGGFEEFKDRYELERELEYYERTGVKPQ